MLRNRDKSKPYSFLYDLSLQVLAERFEFAIIIFHEPPLIALTFFFIQHLLTF
jgi:hypothetical protein